jgi:ELWxxDGT repeat protein
MKLTTTLCAICVALTSQSQPVLVTDIYPGTKSSNPTLLTEYKNKLYFFADDSVHGRELWKYDGINPPVMVYDIYPGTSSSLNFSPISGYETMSVINGLLYFGASNGIYGTEIMTYDGVNPPVLAKDINVGSTSSIHPYIMTSVNSKLYFSGVPYFQHPFQELWEYSPTTNAVRQLGSKQIYCYPQSPTNLCAYNNKLYLCSPTKSSSKASGYAGLVYDPLSDSVSLLPCYDSSISSAWPGAFTVINNQLFFFAAISNHGYQLLKYNDTTPSVRITNLNSKYGNGTYFDSKITLFNDAMYFCAQDTIDNHQLYKVDTVNFNCSLAYSFNARNSMPRGMTKYAGKLFLQATDTIYGTELFVIDSTGVPAVIDNIAPGKDSSMATYFTVVNHTLYFVARNSTHGTELYKYYDAADGTPFYPTQITTRSIATSTTLYPNPANNDATLEISLKETQILNFSITDMQGRIVYRIPAQEYPVSKSTISIPMQSFSPGIYLYCFTNQSGELLASGKLVKE